MLRHCRSTMASWSLAACRRRCRVSCPRPGCAGSRSPPSTRRCWRGRTRARWTDWPPALPADRGRRACRAAPCCWYYRRSAGPRRLPAQRCRSPSAVSPPSSRLWFLHMARYLPCRVLYCKRLIKVWKDLSSIIKLTGCSGAIRLKKGTVLLEGKGDFSVRNFILRAL